MIDRFPIIARELITRPRKNTFYVRRVLFVLAAGAGLLMGASMAENTGGASGLYIFQILSVSAVFILPLLAMQAAAETLSAEKEDRTLGLLLLSRLTGTQIILSKLFAALTTSLFGLALLLPLFLLGVSLGGISSKQILLAFVLLIATVFLGAALGLLVGSLIHTRRNAAGGNVAAIIAVFIAPLVIVALANDHLRVSTMRVMSMVNPWWAMSSVVSDMHLDAVLTCTGLAVLLGTLFLRFAFKLLPQQIFKEGKSGSVEDYEILPKVRQEMTRLSNAEKVRGNPIIWKDFHHALGGHSAAWLKFFILTALVSSLILFTGEVMEFEVYMGFFSLYAATIAFFGCIFRCGRSFNREKRQRTLDMLLSTPLSPDDIWRGKFGAALYSVGPWLICGGIAYTLLWLGPEVQSEPGSFRIWLLMLMEYLAMLVAYSLLALQLSLSMKRDRGLVVTFAIIFAYNTIGRAFGAGMTMDLNNDWPIGMLVIDFVFHGFLILGIHSGLTDSLRYHALEGAK